MKLKRRPPRVAEAKTQQYRRLYLGAQRPRSGVVSMKLRGRLRLGFLPIASGARGRSLGRVRSHRSVWIAGTAAVALLVASASNAAQAAPFAVEPGAPRVCADLNPYQAASAVRALCEIRTIPLSAVTERPDGGHDYQYGVGENAITFLVPPAGFNAVTASQSERENYGITPEPAVTETAARVRWEQEVHNFHPSAPPNALYQPVRRRTTSGSAALAPGLTSPADDHDEGDGACEGCWAGYVDTGELKGEGPKVPPFNEAGIVYTEPTRRDDCEHSLASAWVGLGGDGSEPLDQAGTQLGTNGSIAEHEAWIENYEEPVEEKTSDDPIPLEFFATPGANFRVTVTRLEGKAGEHEYEASFYNAAPPGTSYGPIIEKSRKSFTGLSADYIIEHQGEGVDPLANFGNWEVREAWAEGNHTDGPEAFKHEAKNSFEGTRTLATTSGLTYPETGREFSVKWDAYNESNHCKHEDPAPSAITEPATETKGTSTVLNGLVDPNNGETRYHFEYGRTTAYGQDQPILPGEDIGEGEEYVPVHTTLTGLKAGTEYHYRVVATNDDGTSYGQDETVITTLAPPSYSSQFGTKGTSSGQLESPEDAAFDSSENLWVTDSGNDRLEEFTSAGKWVATVGKEGTGKLAFKNPIGIAINKTAGDIYVVDSGNKRVQELTTGGKFVRYIGVKEFTDPNGIAVDASGDLWITDSDTDEVSEYSSTGTYLHSYGALGSGEGDFEIPAGIAVGPDGNIYVADNAYEGRVQELSSSWTEVHEAIVPGAGATEELAIEPETEDLYLDSSVSTNFTVLSPALASVGSFHSIHGEGVRGIVFAKDDDMYVVNRSRDCVEVWVPA